MTEEKELQVNDGKETSSMTDKAIMVITIIGAFTVGRFLGLVGVGAIAIGWFVYDRTKEKLGRFFAVCAGVVSGLAAYGLAAIAIFS